MSCRACNEEPLHGAFLRWKSTNVEIIACREHWLEIREVLMVAQRKQQTNERYSWVCDACGEDNPITNTVCQNSTCKEEVRKL